MAGPGPGLARTPRLLHHFYLYLAFPLGVARMPVTCLLTNCLPGIFTLETCYKINFKAAATTYYAPSELETGFFVTFQTAAFQQRYLPAGSFSF
ncbi:MAG: hypothetical protein BGO39_17790 [Chloroflexi bacterium 54-19]|nr:MAG: hypothetical protein BGO39_17790 [Chloroflexi bacterium 54-19]